MKFFKFLIYTTLITGTVVAVGLLGYAEGRTHKYDIKTLTETLQRAKEMCEQNGGPKKTVIPLYWTLCNDKTVVGGGELIIK